MKVRVNEYKVKNEVIKKPFKIICLSDIHSNVRYLSYIDDKIKKEKPDAIILAGDTFDDGNHPDNQRTYEYLVNLSNKYLVFFCLGNHETYFSKTDTDYMKLLDKNSKCIMLDKMQKGYTLNDINLYSFNMPIEWYVNGEKSSTYLKSLQKIKFDKNGFNLLVSHSPNGIIAPNGMIFEIPGVNLILSGHNHGCVTPLWFRRIFKVGILGPYNKLFVKSAYGYHSNGKTHLIINDGVTKASLHTLNFKKVDETINNILKINMDIIYFEKGNDNLELINSYVKR